MNREAPCGSGITSFSPARFIDVAMTKVTRKQIGGLHGTVCLGNLGDPPTDRAKTILLVSARDVML